MKFLLANQTDSHAISKSAIPTLHLAVCYGCKGVFFFLYFFLFGVFDTLWRTDAEKNENHTPDEIFDKKIFWKPMRWEVKNFSSSPFLVLLSRLVLFLKFSYSSPIFYFIFFFCSRLAWFNFLRRSFLHDIVCIISIPFKLPFFLSIKVLGNFYFWKTKNKKSLIDYLTQITKIITFLFSIPLLKALK